MPATTLLKLLSKRLEALKISAKNVKKANAIADRTQLIPKAFSELASSGIVTSPFDSLTAYFVINLLQKYGQNERSVFSFASMPSLLGATVAHPAASRASRAMRMLGVFINALWSA